MSQSGTDASWPLVKKCAPHARNQLITCAATSLSLYNHSLPKIHFRGPKRLKSADCMSGLCDECCNTSVHSSQITVWALRLCEVSKRHDGWWHQIRTSWFLSSNSFSQSVQCIAIASSTDSPISSAVPRGGVWGVQTPPPEIPKFWQSTKN
jgi:hypothetical protein